MNLNTATNEQLEQYRESVAKVQGIDPLMLDYIWMDDQETGLRNRVLYAKRGAAELLRHKLNISVTNLVMHDRPGEVVFVATGTTPGPNGRQEIAVGSAYTEGLKADKRAHAVMTAQTRAVRRLTLQFVTGGILDETEVQSQANLAPAASAAQLAGSPTVLPPPQVVPSAAPGKDITIGPDAMGNMTRASVPTMPSQTQEQFEATQQALRDEAQRQLLSSREPVSTIVETPPAEPKKRTRRARNTVNLQTEMPAGHIYASGTITPVSPSAVIPESQPSLTPAPIPQPILVAPQTVAVTSPTPLLLDAVNTSPQSPEKRALPPAEPAKPTIPSLDPEKAKVYRECLGKYSQDILPKAGMRPSEGIGGVTMKLRAFATLHTGSTNAPMSEEQWTDLFEFLDGYTASNGAAALVEYINKALGVK